MPDSNTDTSKDNTALDAAITWASHAATVTLASKKKVVLCTLVGAGLGAAVSLLIPNQYASSGVFIAQGSSTLNLPAGLLSAAATMGLDRGSDYSPKFYADLLTSRPVLSSAILHVYDTRTDAESSPKNYLQIERFDDEQPALALQDGIKHLTKRVSASADVRTNIITLTVRARSPQLSHDIATQLLAALDSLNVGFRQNQSRESREFYETRVLQTRAELDSAEATVRTFLQRNRVITSPALQFELQRLQREAERKQSVYAIVVQQYEQARLQEARNVPTLTILSPPFVPVKKSYPPRRLIVVVGILLGYLVAFAEIAVSQGLTRFSRDEPAKWQALQEQVGRGRRSGPGRS